MPEIPVYLRFHESVWDDRADFVERLKAVDPADFEVAQDDDGLSLRIEATNEDAALSRAGEIVRALCDGTELDSALITVSLAGWA